MCFSETVSFVSGGILLAGGILTAYRAYKTNKRYLPVSMMPLMAGIQQLAEGHVWMGLNIADPYMAWQGAMIFILFSWLMWPTWVPFSIYFLEPPNSKKKHRLLLFALAGLVFGLLLYIPHLFNPDWVKISINNHSIAYEDTMFLDYFIPRWLTYSIYIFLIIMPPMISSYKHMKLFGLTLIITLIVVMTFFSYAYISLFCFLAAVATVHLIYIILYNKCCYKCSELFT